MYTINKVAHPSTHIDSSAVSLVRNTAHQAELDGRLHPEQINLILREGWLKMFVPETLSGGGLTLPEILKIEESLAWADGSLAWVVTLCSGAGWFVGFLDQRLAHEIFENPLVCVAGSGAVTGEATETSDGYEITGRWKYASGALHATVFTANCFLKRNGEPVLDNGERVVRSFVLKKEEVQIIPSWKSMGMIATGSHSFEVAGLRVPADRSFIIRPQHATLNDLVYRYPFEQLADTTLAVNISGMIVRFLELAEAIIKSRKLATHIYNTATAMVKDFQQTINGSRSILFETVQKSWECLQTDGSVPELLLSEVSQASHSLVRCSRIISGKLFPYCGLEATNTETEINRVWRNLHTAMQHSLFLRK